MQNSSDVWAQSAKQLQEMITNGWAQAMQARTPAPPAAAPPALGALPLPNMGALQWKPEDLQAIQQDYLREASALLQVQPAAQNDAPPWATALQADKRFAHAAWADNALAAQAAVHYLLQTRTLMRLADTAQADAKTRNRLRFALEQWSAAAAPSNFLCWNAEALKKATETQGQSIAQGIQNLMEDMRQGHISMTNERLFTVGSNVATSEGAVVFENALFQLIEYKPLTAKVYEKPLLMVPPCINKFYILDLQPENSLVRYAVSQGHRTFMVSWRNPDATLAHSTWDDYIENAVIRAIAAVQDISGAPTINTLGFCVGGTMLSTAQAVLAGRGQSPVASTTLLTTFLDFSDAGVLDVFIDESFVQYREAELGRGGLMKGADLSSTFSFLRPNDLVWNYVVGNYLKGETPPPFDLLYWNSDSTNLPGPYYAWYLRNTYLENKLIQPGQVQVCGQAIDLRKLTMPFYIYGSREDHIVPIGGAYGSTQVLPGNKRFVMGASGHIAGVINPPAKNKRSHWIRTDARFPPTVQDWLQGANEHKGSWWGDWAQWLQSHAGTTVAAPKRYGKGTQYKALMPAPGSYVQARA